MFSRKTAFTSKCPKPKLTSPQALSQEYAGLSETVDVWTGYSYDSIPHLLEKYGPRSVDLVFMDQKGTRFHSDLALMEALMESVLAPRRKVAYMRIQVSVELMYASYLTQDRDKGLGFKV